MSGTAALHVATEAFARLGPRRGDRRARARAAATIWSSSSPTAGRTSGPLPALRDQVAAALVAARARRVGRRCSTSNGAYLDDFWARADVEIEGDAELQQAVRFALFQVLSAGARAERRAIPPRA